MSSSDSQHLTNLSANQRIVLLIKEVEKTHKTQIEVKNVIKLVKRERENILYELKQYQHLFSTYNQLQNRLAQLLNKNQDLAKHKCNLFKAINHISKAINDKESKGSEENANNSQASDRPVFPCLTTEEITEIKLKTIEKKQWLPPEIHSLPTRPIINRFAFNKSLNTDNNNSNKSRFGSNKDNNSYDKKGFKKIDFVYSNTIQENKVEDKTVNENVKKAVNETAVSDKIVDKEVVNKALIDNEKEVSSNDVSKSDQNVSDERINKLNQNCITFIQKNEQTVDSNVKELKISEKIDNNCKEQNRKTDDNKREKSINSKEIRDEKCDENYIKSKNKGLFENKSEKQKSDVSHISKLRKNLIQSEDKHLFEEITIEKSVKNVKESNDSIVMERIDRKRSTDLRDKPKDIHRISSIAENCDTKKDIHKDRKDRYKDDKECPYSYRKDYDRHKKSKEHKSEKRHRSKRYNEKRHKNELKSSKYSRESKSKPHKYESKPKRESKVEGHKVESIVKLISNELLKEEKQISNSNETKVEELKSVAIKICPQVIESTEQEIDKSNCVENVCDKVNEVKTVIQNDNNTTAGNNICITTENPANSNIIADNSKILPPKNKRSKLTFKLQRNQTFSINMNTNKQNLDKKPMNTSSEELKDKLRQDLLQKNKERIKNIIIAQITKNNDKNENNLKTSTINSSLTDKQIINDPKESTVNSLHINPNNTSSNVQSFSNNSKQVFSEQKVFASSDRSSNTKQKHIRINRNEFKTNKSIAIRRNQSKSVTLVTNKSEQQVKQNQSVVNVNDCKPVDKSIESRTNRKIKLKR